MIKYLYNGIELPDINAVWTDKAKYPYAIIQFGDGLYFLILSSFEVQYGTVTAPSKKKSFSKNDGIKSMYFLLNDAWEIISEDEKVAANRLLLGADTYDTPIVWSNHDVTSIDNGVPNDSIFLTASEPVYAGSEPDPEPEPEPEPDPEPSTLISADLYIKKGNKVYKASGGTDGGDTTGLESTVTKHTADIAELGHKIQKNEGDITSIQTTVSGHTNQINGIGDSLTETIRELDDVERAVGALEDFRDGIGNDVTQLKTNVAENTRKIDMIMDDDESAAGAIMQLSNTVSEHTSKIEIIESRIEGTADEVFNLSNTVSDHGTTIGRHTDQLGDLEDDVGGLRNTVSDHGTTINGHSTQLEELDGYVGGLLDTVSGHTTSINRISADLSDTQEELGAIEIRVSGLELSGGGGNNGDAGGEPNRINEIRVNGTAVAIANTIVNLLVASGDENGTIKVNGEDIAVKGLAALAYKGQVSESDLDAALKSVISAKVTSTEVGSAISTALLNYYTAGQTDAKITELSQATEKSFEDLAAVATSGSYNDLTNKPTIPAAYSHPETHPASMITGLSTVATSGSYNDLTNKPTIPAAYTHPGTHPASMITGLADVATSGSYNDLSNKPTIPTVNNGTLTIQKNGTNVATFTANQSGNATANITVPTKVSDLTNDKGYLTAESDPTVPSWAKQANKPTYTASEVGARPSTWTPTAADVGASPTGHKHTKSEITDFPTSMPPTAHNHDDRYYTESEMDTKLAGKAPAYTYGTADLTAGTSPLETGKLYFVYE